MKKNLSKAMAAAMAIGAVAPMMGNTIVANAASVKSNDLITAEPKEETATGATFVGSVRNSNGYKLSTNESKETDGSQFLINRNDAFDGNLTDEVADDTLKVDKFGKDAKIVAVLKGDKADLSDYKYVIAEKLNSREQANAKTQVDAMKKDVESLKAAGYTITTKTTKAEGLTTVGNAGSIKDVYVQGEEQVIATKGDMTYKFIFEASESAKTDNDITSLKNEFEGLKDSFKGEEKSSALVVDNSDAGDQEKDYYTTTGTLDLNVHAGKDVETKPQYVKDRYNNLNKLILFLETNKDKFEVEKSEDAKREVMTIKVYQKGIKTAAGLVQTVRLVNIDELNKDLISNAGQKTDFTGHWAESDIRKAMGKGYIDTTNTFRPKDSITRAEFAKIVCTVFDIKTDSDAIKNLSEPFDDVKSSNWHYKYIVALYNYQAGKNALESTKESTDTIDKGLIINGYENDNFKPNANITRQEAAKMMAAAYELKALDGYYKDKADGKDTKAEAIKSILNVKFDSDTTDKNTAFKEINVDKLLNGVVDNSLTGNGTSINRDVKTKFKDDKEIATWADESVATLSGKAEGADVKNLSIIGGNPDGTFKPKAEINRAEALMMIMRAGDKDYK